MVVRVQNVQTTGACERRWFLNFNLKPLSLSTYIIIKFNYHLLILRSVKETISSSLRYAATFIEGDTLLPSSSCYSNAFNLALGLQIPSQPFLLVAYGPIPRTEYWKTEVDFTLSKIKSR